MTKLTITELQNAIIYLQDNRLDDTAREWDILLDAMPILLVENERLRGELHHRTHVIDEPGCLHCTESAALEAAEPLMHAELRAENERLREALNIACRCLGDVVANGHRRTGPACAGFALTALERIGALDMDDLALDTREPPPALETGRDDG